jgi:hypothetical protein
MNSKNPTVRSSVLESLKALSTELNPWRHLFIAGVRVHTSVNGDNGRCFKKR